MIVPDRAGIDGGTARHLPIDQFRQEDDFGKETADFLDGQVLTPARQEGLPTAYVRQRDCGRTRRVGGVLQRGCKGAAQSFEEIAVDLPFKGEDQVLLP